MTVSSKTIATRVPERFIELKVFYQYMRHYFDGHEDEAFLGKLIPKIGIETKRWATDVAKFFFSADEVHRYVGHTERQAPTYILSQ